MYKYHLGQKIAEGGFGKIYLIKHKDTNKLYVLKETVIHSKSNIEENVLIDVQNNNFFNKYIETYISSNNIYFILEYEYGGNLYNIINNNFGGKLTENQAKFYCVEIALGLTFLHSNGIMYRDLKLENILISKYGHIKLSDFGLASYYNKHTSGCGTLRYMSPEMLIDNLEYTHMTDIWSFGIVIYEMIYGYNPFYNNNNLTIEEHINSFIPQVLLLKYKLKSIYSKNVNKLLKKLLSFKIKKRPSIKKVLKFKWFKNLNIKKINNYNCPELIPYIPLNNIEFKQKDTLIKEEIDKISFDRNFKKLDNAILILNDNTYNCIYYNDNAKKLLNITELFDFKKRMKTKLECYINKCITSNSSYMFTEYIQIHNSLDIYILCNINISKKNINNSNYLVIELYQVSRTI